MKEIYLIPETTVCTVAPVLMFAGSPTGESFDDPVIYDGFI